MKITLCGSTRFMSDFRDWEQDLTVAGHVVYGCPVSCHDDDLPVLDADKMALDLVHLRKILDSDAVVIINTGGYYGESTQRELLWAQMNGLDIYWTNPLNGEMNSAWTLKSKDSPRFKVWPMLPLSQVGAAA